jgi:hypothetical protein
MKTCARVERKLHEYLSQTKAGQSLWRITKHAFYDKYTLAVNLAIGDVIQALRAKILSRASLLNFSVLFFFAGLVLSFISRFDGFLPNILLFPLFSLSIFRLIRLCLYHSFVFYVSFSD